MALKDHNNKQNSKQKSAKQKNAPQRYELLEHTADVYIKAGGSTLAEAFENAAFALFDTIVDASTISPVGEYRVELEAGDLESLLVKFLNQLLFLFETENVLLGEFDVALSEKGKRKMIRAAVRGERYDAKKHPYKTQVKSVTYHGIKIEEDKIGRNEKAPAGERFTVNVLFDV